ncbi:unnamed protein product [Eruca vesicaria subsp. sativa]|uniref:Uncharacterized protein n=1 Tax=Eruca vesicaria subsp. sativa TaxID=29727 RepID=A0ABC8KH56_ERUVS|nr:unnamed protein product [Eruca vesicaria subsp. sativa]
MPRMSKAETNISEAAKEGRSDEVELDWDSYEKANKRFHLISLNWQKKRNNKGTKQDEIRRSRTRQDREDEESCGKKEKTSRERETR